MVRGVDSIARRLKDKARQEGHRAEGIFSGFVNVTAEAVTYKATARAEQTAIASVGKSSEDERRPSLRYVLGTRFARSGFPGCPAWASSMSRLRRFECWKRRRKSRRDARSTSLRTSRRYRMAASAGILPWVSVGVDGRAEGDFKFEISGFK